MKHDALLVLEFFRLPHADDMYHLVGRVMEGFIFEDTKLDGNHPFPQCHYINTSNLKQVVRENGETYLVTRNTTYLMIGCATSHKGAFEMYENYKKLSKPRVVSLTGDPVD